MFLALNYRVTMFKGKKSFKTFNKRKFGSGITIINILI